MCGEASERLWNVALLGPECSYEGDLPCDFGRSSHSRGCEMKITLPVVLKKPVVPEGNLKADTYAVSKHREALLGSGWMLRRDQ